MRRILTILLLALAGAGAAEGDGGQAAAFLKTGVGARALAMGGVGAALDGGALEFDRNPAMLCGVTGTAAALDSAFLPDGLQSLSLGLARNMGPDAEAWAWGLNWRQFRVAVPLERRSADTPQPDGQFDASDNAVQLGMATAWLGGRLRAGATARYLKLAVGDVYGDGWGLDVGASCLLPLSLTASAVVANPVGEVNWNTGAKDTLDSTLRAGLAWRSWDWPLTAALQLEKPASQGLKAGLGAEVEAVRGLLFARVGMDNGAWCGGFGLTLGVLGLDGRLDYCAAQDRSLSGALDALAHRVSLNIFWTD